MSNKRKAKYNGSDPVRLAPDVFIIAWIVSEEGDIGEIDRSRTVVFGRRPTPKEWDAIEVLKAPLWQSCMDGVDPFEGKSTDEKKALLYALKLLGGQLPEMTIAYRNGASPHVDPAGWDVKNVATPDNVDQLMDEAWEKDERARLGAAADSRAILGVTLSLVLTTARTGVEERGPESDLEVLWKLTDEIASDHDRAHTAIRQLALSAARGVTAIAAMRDLDPMEMFRDGLLLTDEVPTFLNGDDDEDRDT